MSVSIEQIQEYLEKGQFSKVEAILLSEHEHRPKDETITHFLACLYLDKKEHYNALPWLVKTVKLSKETYFLLTSMGKCYELCDKIDLAIKCYQRAFSFPEADVDFAHAFAVFLSQQGKDTQALSLLNVANQCFLANVDLLLLEANVLLKVGEIKAAISHYEKAHKVEPQNALVLNCYANALYKKGDIDCAKTRYQQMYDANPKYSDGIINYASFLHEIGEMDLAALFLKKVMQYEPDSLAVNFNYANLLSDMQKVDEAKRYYQKSLEIAPEYAGIYNNYANLCSSIGQITQAIDLLEKALVLSPKDVQVLSNLGALYLGAGQAKKAILLSEKVMQLNNTFIANFQNMLYAWNYVNFGNESSVFQLHKRIGERIAHISKKLTPARSFSQQKISKNTRIRVGYVSGDFCLHSVSFFFAPLLAHHDVKNFEIFCYNNRIRADIKTDELKAGCEHWREIIGLNDAQVYECIQKDNIDILIDLSGHTSGNRLSVFALKPARIQLSWLGYPNTTGLPQIEYRITDAIADPKGVSDERHTEKLIRLKNSAWCYKGDESLVLPNQIPAIKNGYITYGSFNHAPKLNDEVIQTWSELLLANPTSRLVLKTRTFVDSKVKEYFLSQFTRQGINENRVELLSMITDYRLHMEMYNNIDIALDPFPYNGTTTTFEALWMGVPVITLSQEAHRARVSESILMCLNRKKWVQYNKKDYIEICVSLSNDIQGLTKQRKTLRNDMLNSVLCDASAFAREMEAQYYKLANR